VAHLDLVGNQTKFVEGIFQAKREKSRFDYWHYKADEAILFEKYFVKSGENWLFEIFIMQGLLAR
jgi:hypothetical protein